jgi:hypothetical protein
LCSPRFSPSLPLSFFAPHSRSIYCHLSISLRIFAIYFLYLSTNYFGITVSQPSAYVLARLPHQVSWKCSDIDIRQTFSNLLRIGLRKDGATTYWSSRKKGTMTIIKQCYSLAIYYFRARQKFFTGSDTADIDDDK